MTLPDNLTITIPILVDAINADTSIEQLAKRMRGHAAALKISVKSLEIALISAFNDKAIIDGANKIDAATRKLITSAASLASAYGRVDLAKKKAMSKATFPQAQAMVSGLNVEEDFSSSITNKAIAERTRLTSDSTRAKEADIVAYGNQLDQVNKLSDGFKKQDAAQKKVAGSMNQVTTSSKSMGSGLWGLRNIARTVLGTLTAMSIFLITQFVGQALKKAIDSVKQLEKAVLNLSVAEKSLSRAGIDITYKDFENMAKAVKATGISISEIDLTNLIANTAAGTRDLKLSVQQMQDLAVATAAIAFTKGKTVEDVQKQLQLGITTSGRGLKDLDIMVDAQVIQEKAVNAGLVANAEAYDALTAAQKQEIEVAALILIINDHVKTSLEDISLLNGSVTQSSKELTTAWENLTTVFGESGKPFLVTGINLLTIYLQSWIGIFTLLGIGIAETILWFSLMGRVIDEAMSGSIKSVDDLRLSLEKNRKELAPAIYNQMFPQGVSPIQMGTKSTGQVSFDIAKALGLPSGTGQDTPTLFPPKTEEELLAEAEDIAEAIEKAKDTIDNALADLEFDQTEAKIDLNIKLEDIDQKWYRGMQDLLIDFNQKIGDINRDFNEKKFDINQDANEKRDDANAKAHEDEINAEKGFQNKLLALKEKFLMDLDDALHARDARQVLRLIRQYNLDKARLIRERNDEKVEKEIELANNLKSIEEDRKRRLADAERERKQKIADAKRDWQERADELLRAQQRERDDARKDYERKLEDLQRAYAEKRNAMIREIILEKNLNQEGAYQVYLALSAYRPGGMIWNTWESYLQYVKGVQAAVAGASASSSSDDFGIRFPNQEAGSYYPSTSSSSSSGMGGSTHYRAGGGTVLADRPTTVTFGEAGLEMAKFIPIGRTGKDMNKVFGNLGGGSGGVGGNLKLQIVMSEGLIASIVDTSLRNVTSVFESVKRERK